MFENQQQLQLTWSGKASFKIVSILQLQTNLLPFHCLPKYMTLFGKGTYFSSQKIVLAGPMKGEETVVTHKYELYYDV